MTRKQNKKQNKAPKKVARKAPSNKTPFSDVGSIVGKSLAGITGLKGLSGVGKWLGSGIGSIFGSGDYTITGPTPDYNIMSGQVPQFSKTHATNIVSHREYLGDITGTSAFTNLSYPLNPGMSQTFPWLATIASAYQQYKFHGLIFEFRPLITDFVTSGAPGVVVLTTNYDANKSAYISRQEAENAEFATSTKPTKGLMHLIECNPKEVQANLYNVRAGTPVTGTDLRFYDYGTTQFITQGNPAQTVGELWVSYTVEFFKPTMSSSNDVVLAEGFKTSRNTCNSSSPFGSVQTVKSGLLTGTATTSTISVTTATIGTKYLWSVTWTAATSVVISAFSNAGITGLNLYNGGLSVNANSGSGTTSQTICVAGVATANTITFQVTSSTIVGACNVDVILSVLDDTITA